MFTRTQNITATSKKSYNFEETLRGARVAVVDLRVDIVMEVHLYNYCESWVI